MRYAVAIETRGHTTRKTGSIIRRKGRSDDDPTRSTTHKLLTKAAAEVSLCRERRDVTLEGQSTHTHTHVRARDHVHSTKRTDADELLCPSGTNKAHPSGSEGSAESAEISSCGPPSHPHPAPGRAARQRGSPVAAARVGAPCLPGKFLENVAQKGRHTRDEDVCHHLQSEDKLPRDCRRIGCPLFFYDRNGLTELKGSFTLEKRL